MTPSSSFVATCGAQTLSKKNLGLPQMHNLKTIGNCGGTSTRSNLDVRSQKIEPLYAVDEYNALQANLGPNDTVHRDQIINP